MGDQERELHQQGGAVADAGPSLLDEIMTHTKIKPSDESYNVAKDGLQAFLKHLIDGGRIRQNQEQDIRLCSLLEIRA